MIDDLKQRPKIDLEIKMIESLLYQRPINTIKRFLRSINRHRFAYVSFKISAVSILNSKIHYEMST